MNDALIPCGLSITAYMHCAQCITELPKGQSPKEWQRIQAGFTREGLQVWCTRHECNVVHIDFEGQCHPATMKTAEQANG